MYNVEAVGLLGSPSPPVCNNAIGAVVERIYIAEIRCSFCCGVERQVRLVLTPRMDDGVNCLLPLHRRIQFHSSRLNRRWGI